MATDTSILAGWAAREITPIIPCWMGGYAARSAPANAAHDPLSAYALAFGTQERPFVVIVCDLLDVKETMVREVRRRVATQYAGAAVWLGAIHTHAGPDVDGFVSHAPEPPDPTIRERIIAGASSAAEEAIARLHPVWVRWASGAINGIATNRGHPDQSADISLDLLCFYETSEQARPVALFGSFPCHPTVLGAGNLALSADLPGAYRRQLKVLLGAEPWIALATGAAGDISTRHMRQGQGFDELERFGRLLAQQAYTLLPTAQPLKLDLPSIYDTVVVLEQKEPLAPDKLAAYAHSLQERMGAQRQAGNLAQARTLETALQGLQAAQKRTLTPGEQVIDVTVTAARIGDLALAAVPGELYNSLGAAIKQVARRPLLLLGYTNGYVGYIPAREAYAEMDYEVLMSPFAPGSGERLVKALGMLLTKQSGQASL